PAIIEAARLTGAQAIHPGYGFLSEDPDFAEICAADGIVFVGPDPNVMSRLGDTATTRALMSAAGVPVLPGTTEPVRGAAELAEAARSVGLPLIVKACAGGGGRGMAVVHDWDELLPTYRRVRAAARTAFGSDEVYVERF